MLISSSILTYVSSSLQVQAGIRSDILGSYNVAMSELLYLHLKVFTPFALEIFSILAIFWPVSTVIIRLPTYRRSLQFPKLTLRVP